LVGWDALLVLDLCFHIVDGVRCLNIQCDGFTSQSFDKDLHATTEAEHQVQCRFLLNIVIRKCTAILQLFPCENQALLIRRDTLFVLDLCLDIVNGVRCFDIQSNCFAGQSFDKDLHATAETEHQMECRFFLDVVI